MQDYLLIGETLTINALQSIAEESYNGTLAGGNVLTQGYDGCFGAGGQPAYSYTLIDNDIHAITANDLETIELLINSIH